MSKFIIWIEPYYKQARLVYQNSIIVNRYSGDILVASGKTRTQIILELE